MARFCPHDYDNNDALLWGDAGRREPLRTDIVQCPMPIARVSSERPTGGVPDILHLPCGRVGGQCPPYETISFLGFYFRNKTVVQDVSLRLAAKIAASNI